jgi:hypothetical protein
VAANWPEIRRQMQQELRTSTKPVSAFFLLTSPDRIPLLIAKLQPLRDAGITDPQIKAIADLATDLFSRYTPADDFQESVSDLWYEVKGERCWGRIQIRNVPGHGFEVELELPGILAANTPELRGDGYTGFWTEFMPPAFYD